MPPEDDITTEDDSTEQWTGTLSSLDEYNHDVYGAVTLLFATEGVTGDIPFNKGDGLSYNDIVVFQLEDFDSEVRVQSESLFRQRI